MRIWKSCAGALVVLLVGCGSPPVSMDAGASDAGSSSDGGAGCELDGVRVAEGAVATWFVAEHADVGEDCEGHARRCVGGALDGEAAAVHATCEDERDLHLYVDVDGSDAADGRSEASALSTLRAAIEKVAAFAGSYDEATVHVGPGEFEETRELRLDHPVRIVGAGRDDGGSQVSFRIERTHASVRVMSGGVVIEDLAIHVELVHGLTDEFYVGGRGEFGTGVTVGEYLSTTPSPRVDGVTLRRLRISRSGDTAAAMTIVGRVANVLVEDIRMTGNHSTATILHWGAHSSIAPAPAALYAPGYEVYESYHPHGITIRDLDIERSARFAVISSSYDVTMSGYRGETAELLFILPGDEIDRYAQEEDRGRIMSGIDVGDFEVAVRARNNSVDFIRTTAVGTSKVDSMRRLLPIRGMAIHDIRVLSVDRTEGHLRYGVNAAGTRGEDITFSNLHLADLASRQWVTEEGRAISSFGVYLRDAEGVTVEDVTTHGRYGLAIIDSQGITVRRGTFEHLETGATTRSYGIFTADDAAPYGPLTGVTLEGLTVTGYDVGIAYPGPGRCDAFTLSGLSFVSIGEVVERPESCL